MSAFIAFSARASAALALSAGGGGGASPGKVGSSPVIGLSANANAGWWTSVRRWCGEQHGQGGEPSFDGQRKKIQCAVQCRNPFSVNPPAQNLFPPRLQPCPAKKAAKPRCVACHVCSRNRGREPGNRGARRKNSRPCPPPSDTLLPSFSHTHTLHQPLKKPKAKQADLDDDDKAFLQKKKEEAAALKALREKAASKGGFAKVKGSK